jgi:hypothetical protein
MVEITVSLNERWGEVLDDWHAFGQVIIWIEDHDRHGNRQAPEIASAASERQEVNTSRDAGPADSRDQAG